MLDTTEELQMAKFDAHYTLLTNTVAFIGYTILVWDHLLTFSDETKYIWAKAVGSNPSQRPLIYMFLFNRYFTPLAFIGNLTAYLGRWSPEHCKHFVRYEGVCVAIAIGVAELVLWLRVRALYWNRKFVSLALLAIWLFQQSFTVWLLTNARAVAHKETFDHACTMIFSSKVGHFPPSLSAWLPLIYNTLVIGLVLYRCIPHWRMSTSRIIDTLIRDGILYYGVLFSLNFVLGMMIIAAPDATKNIVAQLEQLLSVAMISRITLSLQREGRRSMNGTFDLPCISLDAKKGIFRHIDIELAELCPAQIRNRAALEDERDDRSRSARRTSHMENASVVATNSQKESFNSVSVQCGGLVPKAESETTCIELGMEGLSSDRDFLHDDGDRGESGWLSTIVEAPIPTTLLH